MADTPLYCPCCGGAAKKATGGSPQPALFPFAVKCQICGLQTAWSRTLATALFVWNRRVSRKLPKRARDHHPAGHKKS